VDVAQIIWSDSGDRERLQTTSDVLVQSSAHGTAVSATVEILSNSSVRITWSEAQRRIAPGQSVVLYNVTNTHVLGGGIAMAE
jgi:tRNA-specific 2-thiouridylase